MPLLNSSLANFQFSAEFRKWSLLIIQAPVENIGSLCLYIFIWMFFEKTQDTFFSYWPQPLQKEKEVDTKSQQDSYSKLRKKKKKRKIFGAWVKWQITQAESFRRKEIRRESEGTSLFKTVLRGVEILPSTLLTKCKAM